MASAAAPAPSSAAARRVFVVGVGMTKFLRPRDTNPDYPIMAAQAARRALRDAGIDYNQVQQAAVRSVTQQASAVPPPLVALLLPHRARDATPGALFVTLFSLGK